jgi:hypothetical protein
MPQRHPRNKASYAAEEVAMHPAISTQRAKSRIARPRQPRQNTTQALLAGPLESPRHPPADPGTAATASPAPGPADQAQMRHLEKTGGWTRHERLRILWYRLRLTVQEMNYATRRMTELQTRLPERPPSASDAIITT